MYFEIIAYQGIIPTLALVGILGNALIVLVYLYIQTRRSSAALLIIALASDEILYLVSALAVFTLPTHVRLFGYALPVTFGTLHTTRTIALWLAILLMFDRFLALRFPLRHQAHVTLKVVRYCVLTTALGSFAFNGTRFFEIYPAKYSKAGIENGISSLRLDPQYIVYVTWMNLILLYAIPLTVVGALNIYLWWYVKISRVRQLYVRSIRLKRSEAYGLPGTIPENNRCEAQPNSAAAGYNRYRRAIKAPIDNSVTTMLLVEASVFLVCNTLPMCLNLVEAIDSDYFQENLPIELVATSSTLALLNAALRLPLYVVFGSRFRKQLRNTLSCRKRGMSLASLAESRKMGARLLSTDQRDCIRSVYDERRTQYSSMNSMRTPLSLKRLPTESDTTITNRNAEEDINLLTADD